VDTHDTVITRELHVIRAHLLHYSSLLEDFRKSIDFILETPNPVMDPSSPETARERRILEREGKNLLSEVERLQASRSSQDMRLRNVINLVSWFSCRCRMDP